MRDDELIAVFDRLAGDYDAQWEGMAAIRDALFGLVDSRFASLPENARVLCVGVGTGAEVAHLARTFSGWTFTAVEPSRSMLDVCRERAEREGFASRCRFHHGYLDTLPGEDRYDAATSFLVSQFILERGARSAFFRTIAERLKPGGVLATSDLASGADPAQFEPLLLLWLRLMVGPGLDAGKIERARAAYRTDVAVLSPAETAAVIGAGGFAPPVQIFQAGLLHAWIADLRSDGTVE